MPHKMCVLISWLLAAGWLSCLAKSMCVYLGQNATDFIESTAHQHVPPRIVPHFAETAGWRQRGISPAKSPCGWLAMSCASPVQPHATWPVAKSENGRNTKRKTKKNGNQTALPQ